MRLHPATTKDRVGGWRATTPVAQSPNTHKPNPRPYDPLAVRCSLGSDIGRQASLPQDHFSCCTPYAPPAHVVPPLSALVQSTHCVSTRIDDILVQPVRRVFSSPLISPLVYSLTGCTRLVVSAMLSVHVHVKVKPGKVCTPHPCREHTQVISRSRRRTHSRPAHRRRSSKPPPSRTPGTASRSPASSASMSFRTCAAPLVRSSQSNTAATPSGESSVGC